VCLSTSPIIGEAECDCTVSFEITPLDDEHVRVDFASPVLLLPPLTWPGSYALSGGRQVLAVTPGPSTPAGDFDSVEYVTLTTTEQHDGTTYTLEISGLEAA
jgi:hypothetical protein